MIVKEVLLNALANSGHIHDGDDSVADELELARRLFNTEMRFYSSKNLITAYQSVIDIPEVNTEQVIGKYNVKKGCRVYEMEALPSVDKYVKGRDFIRKKSTFFEIREKPGYSSCKVKAVNNTDHAQTVYSNTQFKVAKEGASQYTLYADPNEHTFPFTINPGDEKEISLVSENQFEIVVGAKVVPFGVTISCVVTEGYSIDYAWMPCPYDYACDYMPDIVCNNMERVVSVMYKNGLNQWESLRFVPLSQFFTEKDDLIYCTSAAGENKVKLLIPEYIKGRDVKLVYNTNMNFQKNDVLELPDNHIALVETAVTVALLRHDADSDPTRFNNYSAQLKEIVDNIESTTVTERRIMRSGEEHCHDMLRSGRFITNRFSRG